MVTAMRASCWPDQCFCEAMRPGGILQPVNAISSLAFLLVMILVLHRRDSLLRGDALFLAFGLAVTGLGSFWYHARFSFASQVADIAGMYLVASFMILRRWLPSEAHRAWVRVGAFLAANAVLLGVQLGLPSARRVVFASLAVVACAGEWRVAREGRLFLRAAIAVLAVAGVAWFLDWSRVLCDPASPLQGHAVWHVLGASAAALLVRYCEVEHGRT